MKYIRILQFVRGSLWAITPDRLGDIVDVLAFQALGGKLEPAELAEYVALDRVAGPVQRIDAAVGGSVAVLPLRGLIAHRATLVDDLSGPGATSTERFGEAFREAVADQTVRSIVIDIDSPGGTVNGVTELATEIRAARGTKPIVALADTGAASAAYWIASATDSISVAPSGQVGSVGVYTAHEDLSEALEREGRRVTLISAGPRKVEGNPFGPLDAEALADIQRRVDGVYGRFVDDIAAGRGVSAAAVEQNYGQGRTLDAVDALAAGMVDRVETRQELFQRVTTEGAGGPARGARVLRHAAEFQFSTQ